MAQANPDRGQIAMEVGGTSYIMQLSPNALSLLRKETGLGLKGLVEKLQADDDDPDFEFVGTIIWASMVDHHPDLTKEEAMRLVPAGGLEEIVEKMQAIFAAAFPKSTGAAANPPKATTKS